jgi:hypothetical protein
MTEHPVGSDERIVIAVNNSPVLRVGRFALKEGWRLDHALVGEIGSDGDYEIGANDGVAFRVIRDT